MDESFPEVLMPLLAAHHSGEKLLLLFDYDGTLTPIADYPWLAQLAPRMRDRLAQLAAAPRVQVGILSGRRLEEVEQMVDVPGLFYCGLSGIALKLAGSTLIHPAAAKAVQLIDDAAQRLAAIEQVYPGAWVEHKRYGFTVHLRGVAPTLIDEAHTRVLRFLDRAAAQLRILDGPLAVEVTVAGAWTKGDAVRMMVEQVGEPVFVFYAGDAANDRDAFGATTALGGITLGVGPDAPPATTAHIDDPDTLTDWLSALLHALQSATVET